MNRLKGLDTWLEAEVRKRDARIAALEASPLMTPDECKAGLALQLAEINQLRAELAALNAKLDASKFCANVADDLRAELDAIKAQEPVAEVYETTKSAGSGDDEFYYLDISVRLLSKDLKKGDKLYAAPVAKQAADDLRAELAAMKAQEPVAQVRVYVDADGVEQRVVYWDGGKLLSGTKLYAAPVAKQGGQDE